MSVGSGVAVGGRGVAVGGTGVFVDGNGVALGSGVSVEAVVTASGGAISLLCKQADSRMERQIPKASGARRGDIAHPF